MSSLRLPLLVLIIVLLQSAGADAQTRYEEYEVVDGDTCASVATKVYGDPARYDLIHQANDLGEAPHDLKPGSTLRLPKVADALLAQEQGAVMFRTPHVDWSAANVGLELFQSWRLNTLERARALVEFRDDSEFVMRQNTLIVIYGGSANRSVRSRGRAKLESGALRARLSELGGGKPLTVETESSTSQLMAGAALVTVDEGQAARVANHGGAPIAVTGKAGGKVDVNEGFGSKVEKGKRPTPPRPLPPSPKWKPGARVFPTFAKSTVRAEWEAVAEAKEYFVELTSDKLGVHVLRSAYVPANVQALEVQELPPGTYFATVSAIDGDRFEGVPSVRQELQVVSFSFDRRYHVGEDPPRFVAGAPLQSPQGLRCSSGSEAPSEDLLLMPASPLTTSTEPRFAGHVEARTLVCVDTDNTETQLPIELEVPRFELSGPTLIDGVLNVPARRGVSLDVAFESVIAPLNASSPALEVDFIPVGTDSAKLRVTDRGGDGGASTLQVRLKDQVLVELPVIVSVDAAPVVSTDPILDFAVGVIAQSQGARVVDRTENRGTLIAARISGRLIASRYFRAGLFTDVGGAAFAPEKVLEDLDAFIAGLGAEVVFTIPVGRVQPFLSLGFEGWITGKGTSSATQELGLGLDVRLADRNGLRLAGRAVLLDAADTPGVGLGGHLGYFWEF